MNPELREMLSREGARFEVISHREVFTAQERAAVCHIPGRLVAKVVVVRDGDWHAMAVLPAASNLDIPRLRQATGRSGLGLAKEPEFARLFPGCDIGAMPPFGRMYGLEVFLDRSLAEASEMVFEGGTHREEIKMPVSDYVRIERPAVVQLAVEPRAA
jgi:Ala-tRNA(Pro) deacylase